MAVLVVGGNDQSCHIKRIALRDRVRPLIRMRGTTRACMVRDFNSSHNRVSPHGFSHRRYS